MENNNINLESMKRLPLFLQYLYLIPNDDQPYDIFRNVGFALKSAGANKDDFIRWAKLSDKHLSKTGGKFTKNFDNFLIGKQCLKLPYLKIWQKNRIPNILMRV